MSGESILCPSPVSPKRPCVLVVDDGASKFKLQQKSNKQLHATRHNGQLNADGVFVIVIRFLVGPKLFR